tara:strand:- start:241 stop:933 length:693 start_codon:yes stop_codon:yes gene_type:complete
MSFRTLNKTEKTSTNPAVNFLEWKSEKKCFQYYDKEKAENVEVHLPLKIKFLEDFHTIKGFSDSESTGIYSNEIKFTSKDVLNVKTFSGKEIASGLYNDIRLKIIDAGGKYHKSIYCILNGEIVNISIKGSVVSAFSLFSSGDKKMNIQGNSNRFESHFIEINDFKEMKKGATKYTVPNFTIGKSYSKKDLELAKDNYSVIVEYFKEYSKKDTNNITVVDAEEVSPEVEF